MCTCQPAILTYKGRFKMCICEPAILTYKGHFKMCICEPAILTYKGHFKMCICQTAILTYKGHFKMCICQTAILLEYPLGAIKIQVKTVFCVCIARGDIYYNNSKKINTPVSSSIDKTDLIRRTIQVLMDRQIFIVSVSLLVNIYMLEG